MSFVRSGLNDSRVFFRPSNFRTLHVLQLPLRTRSPPRKSNQIRVCLSFHPNLMDCPTSVFRPFADGVHHPPPVPPPFLCSLHPLGPLPRTESYPRPPRLPYLAQLAPLPAQAAPRRTDQDAQPACLGLGKGTGDHGLGLGAVSGPLPSLGGVRSGGKEGLCGGDRSRGGCSCEYGARPFPKGV